MWRRVTAATTQAGLYAATGTVTGSVARAPGWHRVGLLVQDVDFVSGVRRLLFYVVYEVYTRHTFYFELQTIISNCF